MSARRQKSVRGKHDVSTPAIAFNVLIGLTERYFTRGPITSEHGDLFTIILDNEIQGGTTVFQAISCRLILPHRAGSIQRHVLARWWGPWSNHQIIIVTSYGDISILFNQMAKSQFKYFWSMCAHGRLCQKEALPCARPSHHHI